MGLSFYLNALASYTSLAEIIKDARTLSIFFPFSQETNHFSLYFIAKENIDFESFEIFNNTNDPRAMYFKNITNVAAGEKIVFFENLDDVNKITIQGIFSKLSTVVIDANNSSEEHFVFIFLASFAFFLFIVSALVERFNYKFIIINILNIAYIFSLYNRAISGIFYTATFILFNIDKCMKYKIRCSLIAIILFVEIFSYNELTKIIIVFLLALSLNITPLNWTHKLTLIIVHSVQEITCLFVKECVTREICMYLIIGMNILLPNDEEKEDNNEQDIDLSLKIQMEDSDAFQEVELEKGKGENNGSFKKLITFFNILIIPFVSFTFAVLTVKEIIRYPTISQSTSIVPSMVYSTDWYKKVDPEIIATPDYSQCELCSFNSSNGTSTSKDFFISLLTGKYYNIFLGSRTFRTGGSKAQFIILTNKASLNMPINQNSIMHAKKCGVKFIDIGFDKFNNTNEIFYGQYPLVHDFIALYKPYINRIIRGDMYDTAFQGDPFVEEFSPNKVYFSSEGPLLRKSQANIDWINCISPKTADKILDQKKLCAGIAAGGTEPFLRYTHLMTTSGDSLNFSIKCPDQGYLNYYVYYGIVKKYSDYEVIMPNGFISSIIDIPTRFKKDAWSKIGYDGKVPLAIHEYDRYIKFTGPLLEVCPRIDQDELYIQTSKVLIEF